MRSTSTLVISGFPTRTRSRAASAADRTDRSARQRLVAWLLRPERGDGTTTPPRRELPIPFC